MSNPVEQHRFDTRLVSAFVRFVRFRQPRAPVDSVVMPVLRRAADDLAQLFAVAPVDAPPVATLHDTSAELEHRLQRSGARPFAIQTAEQWPIFAEGMPFTQRELIVESQRSAREWLPRTNFDRHGVAAAFHGCGIVKGVLVEQWRQ